MSFPVLRTGFLSVICLLPAGAEPQTLFSAETVDFRREVYPLLSARCFGCHQGRDASSGVRLDDRNELLGTTTGNPLVRAGKSGESRLIQLVSGLDQEIVMPPKGKGKRLSESEIDILKRWIDQGLNWDESLLPPVLGKTDHWAFQSLKRPQVPEGTPPVSPPYQGGEGLGPDQGGKRAEIHQGGENAENRIHNPVDAFVAERHRLRGLQPAAPAGKRVLIRRLFLDLLGFPPSREEVEHFLSDGSPQAYERLVEWVLSSPHYGERWGRHWLDVARWSETEGYESNHPRPFAWRYRDYVIDSFNADKPFDEFIRQQLAGDEMTLYSDENLIATGFLAAARISSNEEDKWLQRNDVLVDVTNATAGAFLGLTLNCSQCHNHKFDPITMRDYYGLQGFFLRGQSANVALKGTALRREYDAKKPADYEPAVALRDAIYEKGRRRYVEDAKRSLTPEMLAAVETPSDKRTLAQELIARRANLDFQATPKRIERTIPDEDRKLYFELKKKIEEIEEEIVEPQTFAYYSPVTSPHELKVLPSVGFYPLPWEPEKLARKTPYIQVRGDVHNIGPQIEAGWPAIFDTVFEFHPKEDNHASRSTLAAWISHPDNPLTARVWVNRIWHFHFGRGIVPSPGDFGTRTERPQHHKLLDWLACELIDSGWSTKHIHRLILTSNTFRQSSKVDPRNAEIDPDNEFLWHWIPRRLETEAVRDAALAVSGELNSRVGGASVPLDEAGKTRRRSLYLFQKRGLPPDMQKLFDGPSEASESCSRRHTSTTALQSLYLLNNRFTMKRAEALAAAIENEAGGDPDTQIVAAFQRVLGRLPEKDELRAAEKFFAAHQVAVSADRDEKVQQGPSPLVQFCQALLNLNEFVYME